MNGFEAYCKLADQENWGPVGWGCTHCRQELACFYSVLARGFVPDDDSWQDECQEVARAGIPRLSPDERQALARTLESVDIRRLVTSSGRRWRFHLAVALETVRADEDITRRLTLAWTPQLILLLGHEDPTWNRERRALAAILADGRCLHPDDVLGMPFPPEAGAHVHGG